MALTRPRQLCRPTPVFIGVGLALVSWVRARSRRRARIRWAPPAGTMRLGSLARRELGEGEPTVVLLHGLAGSNRYWGADYDALASVGRVIAPDLLGFGASPRPSTGYGPTEHTEALAASLTEAGVDEPVVVAGHSLGALIALALAATHPTLVRGVVAFCPPVFHDRVDAARRIQHLGVTARLFALPGPVAHAACRWMCAHRATAASLAGLWRPGLPTPIARDGVQHTWASYSGTMRDVILSADIPAWLDAIDVPVRLVAGDQDPIVDADWLAELSARHTHITLELWPGRDHDLPLTDPGGCRAVIDEMVSRTTAPSA